MHESWVEQERALLLARLDELRPALTEARNIHRRLKALEGPDPIPMERRFAPEVRKAQLFELLGNREMSRSEIADDLGISRPHAGRILKALLIEGKVVDLGDGRFSAAEVVNGRRLPAHTRLEQVLDLVRRTPGMRRKEVALAVGISQARAGQLVNELIDAGRLVDDGRGHLTVAEGDER